MFVSERLIYLQLQKTGCTHITKLLRTCVGGEERGKHSRLHWETGGRFVLGSIRNPWSWYLSLWAYGCAGGGGFRKRTSIRSWRLSYHLSRLPKQLGVTPLPVAETLTSMARNVTKPTDRWRRVYADSDDPGCFREWLAMVFDSRRRFDFGEGFGYSPVSSYAGLLTYRYVRLFWRSLGPLFGPDAPKDLVALRQLDEEQNVLDHAVRTEHLEADLLTALAAAGEDLDGQQRAIVERGRASKTNASSHRDLAYYYDAECLARIAERERFIIDRYGYAPPVV